MPNSLKLLILNKNKAFSSKCSHRKPQNPLKKFRPLLMVIRPATIGVKRNPIRNTKVYALYPKGAYNTLCFLYDSKAFIIRS